MSPIVSIPATPKVRVLGRKNFHHFKQSEHFFNSSVKLLSVSGFRTHKPGDMFAKIYYEDFSLNQSRHTTGRTITEADIVLHAGQTGDFYPHHMDEEWCKKQPFKKRIAHGTLIFSIAVGLTAGVINEVSMTYGYERLRFLKPVFIGDTITVSVTIVEKKDHKKPGYGVVTERVEVMNQNGEAVMVCDHLLLVEKAK